MNDRYDDIINLPHHVSSRYRPMPLINRAAQFGSFSALTGHGAAIRETARVVDFRPELDNDECEQMNRTLAMIMQRKEHRPVKVTYFCPDSRKQGGSFCTVTGEIDKVNEDENLLIMADGTSIPVSQIVEMTVV